MSFALYVHNEEIIMNGADVAINGDIYNLAT